MLIIPDQIMILSVATEKDRQEIYRIRHKIYAEELNQHAANSNCQLADELDFKNHYIVSI